MRFVISIVAVLMILGLAAFGVVSAQKTSTGAAQATASDSPPTAVQTAPIAARRHLNPVSQLAQTDAESAAAAGAAPMQVAQATHGTAPAAANGSPANASAQPKPAPAANAIPACDKPGGMGLARIVEIGEPLAAAGAVLCVACATCMCGAPATAALSASV